jgi:MATE family multidrug resistance protein
MVCTLIAHWCVGLPLGYLLAFQMGFGLIGLWVGLALGLAAAGLYLLAAWSRKASALARGEFTLAGVSQAIKPGPKVELIGSPRS